VTELQLGSRLLIILAVLGFIGGLMIGLWAGWIAWPVQVSNVDVSDLKPSAQDEYIVLIASDYAFDQNLSRAQQRLGFLHDSAVSVRVAALAKDSAAQDKRYAVALAALAVALGSTDNDIALIATTATPTVTDTPPPTRTRSPSLTPIATSTIEASATLMPTHTPTRRPRATATPPPALVADTVWSPAFPTGWPDSAKLVPASVAPGQKYWHLVKGLYCDQEDTRNDCPNLPGGGKGTSIYVMLTSASGARASAPLFVHLANGARAGVDEIGPEKSATDMCNCNYAWEADGSTIQVDGSPSDKVSGLALYSVAYKRDRFHVRYFLTFQLLTR
jgi:hypothetical protein